MELITADANLVFTAALVLMVLIALFEGLALLLGMGFSHILDTLLPDIHVDVDYPDISTHQGGLAKILGWMHVGRVPALIILIVTLTTFGLMGLSLQSTLDGLFGWMLPAHIAWLPVLLCTFPVARVFTGLLSQVLPRDETEAVSRDSFVGLTTTITTGVAQHESAAEARVTDAFGQTHSSWCCPVELSSCLNRANKV